MISLGKATKMNMEEIYKESKSLIINNCEFTHPIEEIMYSNKIKDEIKEETSSTTNIIVTKYADSSSDILDVEPGLDLDNKGKIIEVELLSPNLQHKSNLTAFLSGTVVKKGVRKKVEGNEKKYPLNCVKKKKLKSNSCISVDFKKGNDLISRSEFLEKSALEMVCTECNKQFSSKALLKKHLSSCKVHTLRPALCSKCGKNFSSNYNLKRHMTSCKLCPDNEKSPRYMCQCGRTYSQEWDLKKHKLKCKEGKKKCKHCLVSNCNLLFYHKAQLIAHMKKDHNMIIQDPKIFNFNSFDEFLLWKEKEEEDTFTYYSKQTGSNVSGVSVNTYYVCQHDGSDRTHTSAPRKTERRNKKGRIKTGRLCWSQMNVKEFKDGTVKVTYFPSHTHPVSIADTRHHPLPSSITMEIERRISEMTKLNENEDTQSDKSQDLRKGKKKKLGMSLRTLRALARKNRSLFRITAEAIQKPEDSKDVLDAKTTFQYTASKVLPTNENVMQVLVTDQDEENADDPNSMPVLNVNNEIGCRNSNEELVEDCVNYLNDFRTRLLSRKLPQPALVQIKESLKNMCNMWKTEIQDSLLVQQPQGVLERQEIMMYPPQSQLPVAAEIFPFQEEVNSNEEMNDSLKKLGSSPEKAVYQLIPVDGEETSETEYLYQDSAETKTREYIIITGDHAQLFHSVDSNIQFN